MESRDRHYRRDSYIEGNVVRQRESVPGRSVQPAEKTREQLHQERMRKNAARQNQQRAMAMDRLDIQPFFSTQTPELLQQLPRQMQPPAPGQK